MTDHTDTEPSFAGTIAEGIPHPSVRAQYPDPCDRYDQLVVHLYDRLDASGISHRRSEGAFHLRIERSLASVVDIAPTRSDSDPVAVEWPPSAPPAPLDVAPDDGTLAVAAAYGFVCTGFRVRGATHPSVAGTQGRPLAAERRSTPALQSPHPTLVVDVGFADVTADGFRTQCRRDARIPNR